MTKVLSAATVARRNARRATIAHYAAKGIRLQESQARFITKIGMPTNEYLAVRAAVGLGQPHKPVVRAARVSKALPAAAKVFVSTGYQSHVAAPGGDSAWVDTKGTFYRVSYAGHSAFAQKCADAGIVTSTDKWGSFVGALEDKGWVHISGYTIRNKVSLTAEQVSTLIAWARTSREADSTVRGYLAN